MSDPMIMLHTTTDERAIVAVRGLDYVHAIFGRCHGVLLRKRAYNDNHVMFQIMLEDDEVWHAKGSTPSSYWLPELIEVLKQAHEWIQANCDPDLDGYGYNFKS